MSISKPDENPKRPTEHSTVDMEDVALNKALEECIVELEAGGENVSDIIDRHPQWRRDLEQFLENWISMQGTKAKMEVTETGADDTLQIIEGSSFGDYELLEQIGAGGMGTVFKARQLSLNRIVALKMIVGPHRDHERFRMEAESAASLNHPNIVSIYEIGDYQHARLFFSMQLIDGCDLKRYLELHTVENSQAGRIARSIALAVHYAHQHGILHRDLKPANILMDASGQPHITDFGLAKQIGRDSELTHSGTIIGTPGYMAPEQASGRTKTLTTATDVYSIGAILFAMLTGQAPFAGESPLDILRNVVEEQAPSPKTIRIDLERDLETICLKCLEKSPDQRYGSAELLADDLQRYLSGVPVLARPISYPERFWRWCRRNPVVAGLGTTAFLLLLATVVSMTLLSMSHLRSEKLSDRVGGIEKSEQRALELVNKTRGSLYVAHGQLDANQANIGEAALWFSHAAKVCCDDPTAYAANMTRLNSWIADHPQLIGALLLQDDRLEQAKKQSAAIQIDFRPNADQLLCETGSEIVIWDFRSDEKWVLNDTFDGITCAKWHPNGQQIVIGRTSGHVSFVDLTTREVVTEISAFESPISHFTVSPNGNWLAMTSGNKVATWNCDESIALSDPIVREGRPSNVSFNKDGTRMIIVWSEQICGIYSLENSDTDHVLICEAPCHFQRAAEGRQTFWPILIDNDSLLVSKTDRKSLGVFDAQSGAKRGVLATGRDMYCVAVNPDTLESIICSFRDAKLFQIRRADQELGDATETQERLSAADFRFEHQGRVVAADFGANDIIATGSWDNSVRIWRKQKIAESIQDSAEQFELLVTLPHQQRICHTRFSPSGSTFATVQTDGLVRVWSMPEFRRPNYEVETGPLGSLARVVSQDCWMTSGMSRQGAKVEGLDFFRFDSQDWPANFPKLEMSDQGFLMDACPSMDKRFLITAHANPDRSKQTYGKTDGTAGTLVMWDLQKGQPVFEPLPMQSEPRQIVVHPFKNQAAVCTARMEVILVDTSNFSITAALAPSTNSGETYIPPSLRPIHHFNQQLCYSPDGKRIIAWCNSIDGVWVWDLLDRGLAYPKIETDGWPVNTVDIARDGQSLVYAGGRSNVARIVNLKTGECNLDDLKHPSAVYTARFSPDGSKIVTSCRDGRGRIFDSDTGEMLTSGLIHEADVVDAVFTPDSLRIITLGNDKTLRFWNALDASEALKPQRIPVSSRQILVSPDSGHVVVAGGRNVIAVFDIGQFQQFVGSRQELQRTVDLSELLAGKTINEEGETENLSTGEWFDRWLKYSRR